MDNASKGIKQAIANIDKIVSGIVQRLYLHNMMFDQDPYIKGDFKVVAKGAIGLLHKETLQMRRNEFLMATANPIDAQIVGPEGRAYILREAARGLQMDTNKIVPDQNTFEEQRIQAAAQAMAQQMLQQMMQQMQQQQAPMAGAPQLPAPQEQMVDGSPAGGQMANAVQPMADGGEVVPMSERVLRNLMANGSI